MIKSVLKLLAVSVLGLVGDPTYLWRIGVSVGSGVGLVVLAYVLWPGELALWPGVITLIGAAGVGLLWEWRASISEESTLK